MSVYAFSGDEAYPAYHDGMLLVRLRETPDVTAIAAAGTTAAPATVGLSALSHLQRGGLVRDVIPLSPSPQEQISGTVASTAVGRLAVATTTSDPLSGTSIVQLERDEDLPSLQQTMLADPNVDFAARVPVRYLTTSASASVAVPASDLASLRRRLMELEARLASQRGRRPPGRVGTTPGVTRAPSLLWNLRRIEWDAVARGRLDMGGDVRVGVLDTGIDAGHPDLADRVSRYTHAHPDLPGRSSERDLIGHGTHVAGTIAAGIDNAVGINGICAARLVVWKIFDDQPDYIRGGNVFSYLVDPVMYRRALAEAIDQVDVLNLSIGGRQPPDPQEELLFQALVERGTIVVVAMGNERLAGSPRSYPAAIRGVLAIGATSLNDTVAPFSNSGNHIALSAPGVGIWSTLPRYPGQVAFEALRGLDGFPVPGRPQPREVEYGVQSGTSMAAPHVAGAVALLLGNARVARDPLAVREALIRSADAVPAMGGQTWSPDYGAGRLNLRRLLDVR